jgi:hypothetical protein
MFELHITSLHEFRLFVKLIKNEPITEEDIKVLLSDLEKSTSDLVAAENNLPKV